MEMASAPITLESAYVTITGLALTAARESMLSLTMLIAFGISRVLSSPI
jgi:hypothetical protein